MEEEKNVLPLKSIPFGHTTETFDANSVKLSVFKRIRAQRHFVISNEEHFFFFLLTSFAINGKGRREKRAETR